MEQKKMIVTYSVDKNCLRITIPRKGKF